MLTDRLLKLGLDQDNCCQGEYVTMVPSVITYYNLLAVPLI